MSQESAEKFITWFLDKHLKYGDWFDEWWKLEGSGLFFAWAKEKGQEFINLEKEPHDPLPKK